MRILILNSHTHSYFVCFLWQLVLSLRLAFQISQAMIKLRIVSHVISFCILLVLSCSGPMQQDFELEGTVVLLDSINVPEVDSNQKAVIQQYRKNLEAEMNRLLVYSERVMERGTPEGLLNNFVADLVFEIGKELYAPEDDKPIDFCLLNYGGLRVPLPRGEITYERVFELLPFENEMVVITLSGEKTLELFHYLANATRGMPVSGIKLAIQDNHALEILIQGKEFDINRTYKVLTSDYLAGGGDSMNFFLQPINYELLGMRVRDAIIKHMQRVHAKGEKINSELDGRITVLD